MIKVYKRNRLGILTLIHKYNSESYDLYMSSGGVLTIRFWDATSVLCLAPGEWHVATEGK